MKYFFFSVTLLFYTITSFATPQEDSVWMAENYTKKEVYIPTRDGIKLYTAIYEPKNATTPRPILLNRTPYSIAPYGKDFKPLWNTHYMSYLKDNYILVFQDVRGRYMSEGKFVDVRPFKVNADKTVSDEATDTYDTIEWLLLNVKGNNKKVGMFGISYPGFYSSMGALCGHPSLVAVSPQAPVTDWYMGDDFHHNGAFFQMDAFNFYSFFGKPRPFPTKEHASSFQYPTKDGYKFYLDVAPTLADLAYFMGDSIQFWKEIYAHPDYDKFWIDRNVRNYTQYIKNHTATLVVGGLFDAEDCFGAWSLYKSIEDKAPNDNKLVMGPWSHGGWAKTSGEYLGNVRFGSKTAEWYRENVEIPFFKYHLEGIGNSNTIKEATIFFTGENEWKSLKQWPPVEKQDQIMYLHADGKLSKEIPYSTGPRYINKYTSDPMHPVPYTEDVHFKRTNEYMTDDQRFASRRPDVLTYQTEILNEDVTLAGSVFADIFTTISTTDIDFIVKIIDVFPDDFNYDSSKFGNGNGKNYPMGGYQMLVRGEVMRGKYRNNYADPKPFVPNKQTEVKFKLPDVAHTFKKGHKIMVQVQSTWFPLVDRNPQQFVDIYHCSKTDFIKSDVQISCSNDAASHVILPIIKK